MVVNISGSIKKYDSPQLISSNTVNISVPIDLDILETVQQDLEGTRNRNDTNNMSKLSQNYDDIKDGGIYDPDIENDNCNSDIDIRKIGKVVVTDRDNPRSDSRCDSIVVFPRRSTVINSDDDNDSNEEINNNNIRLSTSTPTKHTIINKSISVKKLTAFT